MAANPTSLLSIRIQRMCVNPPCAHTGPRLAVAQGQEALEQLQLAVLPVAGAARKSPARARQPAPAVGPQPGRWPPQGRPEVSRLQRGAAHHPGAQGPHPLLRRGGRAAGAGVKRLGVAGRGRDAGGPRAPWRPASGLSGFAFVCRNRLVCVLEVLAPIIWPVLPLAWTFRDQGPLARAAMRHVPRPCIWSRASSCARPLKCKSRKCLHRLKRGASRRWPPCA